MQFVRPKKAEGYRDCLLAAQLQSGAMGLALVSDLGCHQKTGNVPSAEVSSSSHQASAFFLLQREVNLMFPLYGFNQETASMIKFVTHLPHLELPLQPLLTVLSFTVGS